MTKKQFLISFTYRLDDLSEISNITSRIRGYYKGYVFDYDNNHMNETFFTLTSSGMDFKSPVYYYLSNKPGLIVNMFNSNEEIMDFFTKTLPKEYLTIDKKGLTVDIISVLDRIQTNDVDSREVEGLVKVMVKDGCPIT